MPEPDKLQKLYNNMLNSERLTETELGNFESFKLDISDSSKAHKFYNKTIGDKIFTEEELGSWNSFSGNLDDYFQGGKEQTLEQREKPDNFDNKIADINKRITDTDKKLHQSWAGLTRENASTQRPIINEYQKSLDRINKEKENLTSLYTLNETDEGIRIFDDLKLFSGEDDVNYFTSKKKQKETKKALMKKYSNHSERTIDIAMQMHESSNKRNLFYDKGIEFLSSKEDYDLNNIAIDSKTEFEDIVGEDEKEVIQINRSLREGNKDEKLQKRLKELGRDPKGWMNLETGKRHVSKDIEQAKYDKSVNKLIDEYLRTTDEKLKDIVEKNYVIYKYLDNANDALKIARVFPGMVAFKKPVLNKSNRELIEGADDVGERAKSVYDELLGAKAAYEASARAYYLNESPEELTHDVIDNLELAGKTFVQTLGGEQIAHAIFGTDNVQRNLALSGILAEEGFELSDEEEKALKTTNWEQFSQGIGGVGGVVVQFMALNALGQAAGIEKILVGLEKGNRVMKVFAPIARLVYEDIKFQTIGAEPGAGAAFYGTSKILGKIKLPKSLTTDKFKNPITHLGKTLIRADISMTAASNLSHAATTIADGLINDKDWKYHLEQTFGKNRSELFNKLFTDFSVNWAFGFSTFAHERMIEKTRTLRDMSRLSKMFTKMGYPSEADYVDNVVKQYKEGKYNISKLTKQKDELIEKSKEFIKGHFEAKKEAEEQSRRRKLTEKQQKSEELPKEEQIKPKLSEEEQIKAEGAESIHNAVKKITHADGENVIEIIDRQGKTWYVADGKVAEEGDSWVTNKEKPLIVCDKNGENKQMFDPKNITELNSLTATGLEDEMMFNTYADVDIKHSEEEKMVEEISEIDEAIINEIPTDKEGNTDYDELIKQPDNFYKVFSEEFSEKEAADELRLRQKNIQSNITKAKKKSDKSASINERIATKRQIKELETENESINAILSEKTFEKFEPKPTEKTTPEEQTQIQIEMFEEIKEKTFEIELEQNYEKIINTLKTNPQSFWEEQAQIFQRDEKQKDYDNAIANAEYFKGQTKDDVLQELPQEKDELTEITEEDKQTSTPEEIKSELNKIETDPSEAQKEAENYKKGHIKVQGFDISIENPKGSQRSGIDENGNKWSQTMKNTYGYFKRTLGKDGDQIDVFLGDNLESNKVFIVDQINVEKAFDEHKVMMGFDNIEEAKKNYLSNYEKNWKGLGNITEVSIENFKKWIGTGTRKQLPAADYKMFAEKDIPAPLKTEIEKPLTTLKPKRRSLPKSKRKIKNPRAIAALEIETDELLDVALVYFIEGGKINSSAIQSLFGSKSKKVKGEKNVRISLLNNKTGLTIKEIAHELWENRPEGSERTTMDYREAVEEVIRDNNSTKTMINTILNRHGIKKADYLPEEELNKALDNLPETSKEELINTNIDVEKITDQFLTDEQRYIINEVIERHTKDGITNFESLRKEIEETDPLAEYEETKELLKFIDDETRIKSQDIPDITGIDAVKEKPTEEAKKVNIDEQKRVSKEINDKIVQKTEQLKQIHKQRSKKQSELDKRNSLFGDRDELKESFAGNLFDTEFSPTEENFKNALDKYDNEIAKIEREIAKLEKQRETSIKEAGKQIKTEFAGDVIKKPKKVEVKKEPELQKKPKKSEFAGKTLEKKKEVIIKEKTLDEYKIGDKIIDTEGKEKTVAEVDTELGLLFSKENGVLEEIKVPKEKEIKPKELQKLDNLNPTSGLFVDYTPQQRMEIPLGDNLTTLDKTSNKSPDDMITIYRGATENQKEIIGGDFITTNYQLAKDYAGNGIVLEKEVKFSDILDQKDEPLGEEYIYRPKPVTVEEVKAKAEERTTHQKELEKLLENQKNWKLVSNDGKEAIIETGVGEVSFNGENVAKFRKIRVKAVNYLDNIKVGDEIKYNTFYKLETTEVLKINKNKKGKVNSVTTKDGKIEKNDIVPFDKMKYGDIIHSSRYLETYNPESKFDLEEIQELLSELQKTELPKAKEISKAEKTVSELIQEASTIEELQALMSQRKININNKEYQAKLEALRKNVLLEPTKQYGREITPDRDYLFETGLTDPSKLKTKEDVADYNARVEIMNKLYEEGFLGEDFINDLEQEYVLTQIGEKRYFEEIVEDKLNELDDFDNTKIDNYLESSNIPIKMSLEDLAVQSKGLTEDLNEAGYILRDGRLLDFSGKRFGGDAGVRYEDHRQLAIPIKEDISGTELMNTFMLKTGAIRIDNNGGAIDIETSPTPTQERIVSKIIKNNSDTWTIDLQDGKRKLSLQGGSVQMALDNIERFYKDKTVGTKPNESIVLEPETKYGAEDIFYSNTEAALNKIKQEKGTPEQFKAMLLKNRAKQAEMDWMGWDTFVEGKKSITKQEIQNFINENKVELEEVVKNDDQYGVYEISSGALVDVFADKIEAETFVKHRKGTEIRVTTDSRVQQETKFAEYQTKGGENYKEFLMTLPMEYKGTKSGLPDGYMYSTSTNGYGIIEEKTGEIVAFSSESQERALGLLLNDLNKIQPFKSPHFDEPNIVAHTRTNERTEGKDKIFLVEEFQSDWASEGREKGYDILPEKERNKLDLRRQELERIGGEFRNDDKDVPVKIKDEWVEIMNKLQPEKKAFLVPDMPFKKNWHELAFKRMLRYAVENNFDKIAWITGEQTADRYDLSKRVTEIEAIERKEKGIYRLKTKYINGETSDNDYITKEKLPDYVGKDLAEKIISDAEAGRYNFPAHKSNVYSGLDLKVGGEWATNLYDRTIPNFVKKYTKKWGGKVGTTEITIKEDRKTGFYVKQYNEGIWQVLDKNNNLIDNFDSKEKANEYISRFTQKTTTVHSLEITPAMRESVMQGQPMFEPKQQYQNEIKQAYGSIKEKETAVKEVSEMVKKVKHIRLGEAGLSDKVKKRTVFKKFKESGEIDFVGQKVNSPQDIADLWAIHRSPYIEKFGVIFVKEGKIIGSTAVTTNSSNFTNTPTLKTIDDLYQKYNADGMYYIHNHPSGNHIPSEMDINLTEKHFVAFRRNGINLIGHIVTDHTKFSYIPINEKPISTITPSGEVVSEPYTDYIKNDVQEFTYKTKQPKLFTEREAIGKGIDAQERIGEIAKALLTTKGYKGAIIYLSPTLEITAYDVFPEGVNKNDIVRISQEGLKNNLGGNVVIAHDGSFNFDNVSLNNTLDVINTKTGYSDNFITKRKKFNKGDLVTLWEKNLKYGEEFAGNLLEPTKSKAFKKWFGDSKVVDKDGKPLVVYHGTDKNFDIFDKTRGDLGAHLGTLRQANQIAKIKGGSYVNDKYITGTNIIPAYVSIKNPLRLKDTGAFHFLSIADDLIKDGVISQNEKSAISESFMTNKEGSYTSFLNRQLRELLIEKGYDGVVYLNRREGISDTPQKLTINDYTALDNLTDLEVKEKYPLAGDSYIAFSPTQIKSATGNIGTFDPTDPSILFESKKQYGEKFAGDYFKVPSIAKIVAKKDVEAHKSYDVILEKINNIKEKYKTTKVITRENIKAVQGEIAKYARQNMPLDKAGKRDIGKLITLVKNTSQPNKIFDVFSKIDDMTSGIKKKRNIAKIDKILKENRGKVINHKKQGKLNPDVYTTLEKIRIIRNLKGISESEKYIEKLDLESEDVPLFSLFGNLKDQTREQSDNALRELSEMINTGKIFYKEKFEARKERLKELRKRIIGTISEKGYRTTREIIAEDGKVVEDWFLKSWINNNQSFEWMMDVISKDKSELTGQGWMQDYFGDMILKATSAESKGVRERIESLDKIAFEIFGVEKSALAKVFQLHSKVEQSTGVTYHEDGKRVEMPLSQNKAYKIWQDYQDKRYLSNFEKMGFDETTITQLEYFIKPEVMKWAKWQLEEFYPEYYNDVNNVYREEFYIDLSKNEYYSPKTIEVTETADSDDGLLRPSKVISSVLNNSLKSTVKHSNEISIIDGDKILMKHILQMEHFKAWVKPVRELGSVFGARSVQHILKVEHGNNIRGIINSQINDFARGRTEEMLISATLDKMRGNFAAAELGLNYTLFPKQLLSVIAYTMDIPTKDYFIGLSEFIHKPHKIIKTLSKSEWLEDRYKKGWTQETEAALKTVGQNLLAGTQSKAQKLKSIAMLPTKLGDRFAIIGGWTIYSYHYKQQMAEHGNKELAEKFAMNKFERIGSRTQQSPLLKDMSQWQKGSAFRIVTMFKTAQQAYFRYETGAWRNLRKGRGSRRHNLKILAITHFILPMTFQYIASLLAGDSDDEKKRRLIRSAILGSFNGFLVAGDIMEYFLNKAVGEWWDFIPTPIIGSVEKFGVGIAQIAKQVPNVEKDKLWEGIKKLDGDLVSGSMDEVELDRILKGLDKLTHAFNQTRTGLPYRPAKKLYRQVGDIIDPTQKNVDNAIKEAKDYNNKVNKEKDYYKKLELKNDSFYKIARKIIRYEGLIKDYEELLSNDRKRNDIKQIKNHQNKIAEYEQKILDEIKNKQ